MHAVQLELFEPNDEMSLMRRELSQVRDSNRRQFKALFAKSHATEKVFVKEILAMREEMDGMRALFLKRKK